jgi:hypothetical protein
MQGSGDQTIVLVAMSNGPCGLYFYCYKGKKTLFFILPSAILAPIPRILKP